MSEYRYVAIPAAVTLGPNLVYGIDAFADHFISRAAIFTKSMSGIRMGIRIGDAFADAVEKKQSHAVLRKEDWLALKNVVDEPKDCGFPVLQGFTPDGTPREIPLPIRTVHAMGEPILDATSKEPAV